MKRLVIASLAALPLGFAAAHTHLQSSIPSNDAVLTAPPQELTLEFSEPTRLTSVTVSREGAQDESVVSVLPTQAAKKLTLPLDVDDKGKYVVKWRAIGTDNHVMSGAVRFTVK